MGNLWRDRSRSRERTAKLENPFLDPAVAAHYEDWYVGPGALADRLEKEVLRELLVGFPGAETVLEVGCGTGHFVRWFEQERLTTAGIDISAPMLAEARRHGSEACAQASASALPFPSRSFDLVVLIATLEFLPEPRRALDEAVRVARQGLLIGSLNRWSPCAVQRRFDSSPVWRRARFFGLCELRRLVANAAGRRAGSIRWLSTSWSLPFHARPLAIPYGDFTAMTARLT
jgi:ubiquinone/menaquinone biosynthesis C-methylase UbiE